MFKELTVAVLFLLCIRAYIICTGCFVAALVLLLCS